MKTKTSVTFFYRPRSGGYSIEAVFELIKKALPSNIEVREYICTTKWKRFHSFLGGRRFQSEINHITGDIHTLALFLDRHRTIITVHDIGRYERDLKGLRKRLFKLLWLSLPLRHAAAITVVSSFTKLKLMQACGIAEQKIRVIPNPADLDGFPYTPAAFNEQSPLVLQIGGGNNKNLHRLIRAIKGSIFRLLIVRPHDAHIRELLNQFGIEFEWRANLTNEQVYQCYLESDIVFFASEYEGFGIPIIEANSVGRAVVTSNISSMPEVAGEAALLINPFSVSEIRNALMRITTDANLRSTLIEAGRRNIDRFSADRVAESYCEVYQTVLDQGRVRSHV